MATKGILLDSTGDLLIKDKQMVVGDSEMQEVGVILMMNQGEQKFEPYLGANLINLVGTKVKHFELSSRIKTQMTLDNKRYEDIKEKIQTTIK
ncbi:hypothetical protein MYRA21_0068 [Myroides sp. A21]|uniref:hypothetical protein n=1 Tax=Myroides sp. A21 TaxID=1583100 RepID=UPI0005804D06|nr:hypothetical protein [Myroides sp. A21]AJA67312.1 hypothetical protein MYRA21_0068 [Myroides sp. A21]